MVQTVLHPILSLWQYPGRRREEERVSQLLLGATVDVRERSDDGAWAFVQGDDTYRGWCESRFLSDRPAALPNALVAEPFVDVRAEPGLRSELVVRLSILSALRVDRRQGNRVFVTLPGGETGWLPSAAVATAPRVQRSRLGEQAVAWGRNFLGTPYLWGGTSAFGLDCSGLAQICYRLVGLVLRRDADIQRSDPRFLPVEPGARQAGDLVFFGSSAKITHVGIDAGDGTFLHAAGGVGVVVTPWGDACYSPGYVDARRLNPALARSPVVRFEAEDR